MFYLGLASWLRAMFRVNVVQKLLLCYYCYFITLFLKWLLPYIIQNNSKNLWPFLCKIKLILQEMMMQLRCELHRWTQVASGSRACDHSLS